MRQLNIFKRKGLMRKSVFMICALLLLANMNRVVYTFFDDGIKLHKIDFDEYCTGNPAYTWVNEIQYQRDNLQEILYCNGWAFAETVGPNDNKGIYLIFKGKKNSYITEKYDGAFSSISEDSDWKNICGNNHNFSIMVSTMLLPSDIYEIYVYVEENEETKGIVSSGRSFRKNGVELYTYSLGEIVNNINPEQIGNLFDYGWIDHISNINGCIEVSGWQAIENQNSEDLSYYLVFVGENQKNITIHVPTIYRTDVGEYLGNNDYIASGFRGALDKKNLPDETGVIYVVAENDGELYRTEAYSYNINATEDSK